MPAASDIDKLFQLPLTEYTAARNALAASLKAAGRAKDATALKDLPKPPLSAWTVNQLYWGHRRTFDRLMAAGEQLRKADVSRLAGKGGGLRAPLEAHRAALREATTRAAHLLRDTGHTPTPELTRRITTTLETLAALGRQLSGTRAGHLTHDVEPPGFNALASLVPRTGGAARGTGRSRVIPFRQRAETSHPKKPGTVTKTRDRQEARKAQRAEATMALRHAERALRDARMAAAKAESTLRVSARRVKVAEKTKAALEKRFEKIAADADGARQEARRVAAAAEEAAQAIADAERARDQARRALGALS
jgi:hypothetical protein